MVTKHADGKSIIFINTKHQGEKIQAWLEANNFKSGLLSGDVPQKKRERLLQQFKENKITTLVATDVAARGLHIDGVDTVINFDLPNDAEDYVHRIGRTARAGASGKAISLVCETYGMNIVDIEAYIDNKIPMLKDYSDIIATNLAQPEKPARRSNSERNKSNQKKPERNTRNANKTTDSAPQKIKKEDTVESVPITKNRQRYMRRSKTMREVPMIG